MLFRLKRKNIYNPYYIYNVSRVIAPFKLLPNPLFVRTYTYVLCSDPILFSMQNRNYPCCMYFQIIKNKKTPSVTFVAQSIIFIASREFQEKEPFIQKGFFLIRFQAGG